MRHRVFAALALAALLITGACAALAAPGDSDGALVTRSYLNGTYTTQTAQAMLRQAQAGTARTEQDAMDRLKALTEGFLTRAGAEDAAGGGFQRVNLSQGDRVELTTGASLLLESGRVGADISSGALVDVTDGIPVAAGGGLAAGHRYIAAEDTACVLTVTDGTAALSLWGGCAIHSSGPVREPLPFTDVAAGSWYYASVRYVYDQGLFQGVTQTQFRPEDTMTRAMLATVLRRLSGAVGTPESAGFTDVPDGAWYAGGVNWAAGAGVVTGYGDGVFLPDADVTREQIAVMLCRYLTDYLGRGAAASGDLSAFPDGDSASSWARDGLSWAVGAGILTGHDTGDLDPAGTATRAQVAAMLQRFAALIEPNP